MKANKLCIPESSLRLLLLQESHGGGLMGHFGRDKTFATLSKNYFCQRCFLMYHASPTVALHVAKLSQKLNPMVFICHFLFRTNHGRHQYGFCAWFATNSKRQGFGICRYGPFFFNGAFHSMQQDRRCFTCCKPLLQGKLAITWSA